MKILELLNDKTQWSREFSARNMDGEPVFPGSEQAVCWCVLGAVGKCYPVTATQIQVIDRLHQAIMVITGKEYDSLGDWNDDPETTFEQVQQVLQLAQV